MKRLIFLSLFAFTFIGIQDVFSESPPEKQTFELSDSALDYEAVQVYDLSVVKPISVEELVYFYLISSAKSENGKPINKARDKLLCNGAAYANVKAVNQINYKYQKHNWPTYP